LHLQATDNLMRITVVVIVVLCSSNTLSHARLMQELPDEPTPQLPVQLADFHLFAANHEYIHDALWAPDGQTFYIVRTKAAVNVWTLAVYMWPWLVTSVLAILFGWLVVRLVRRYRRRGRTGQQLCRRCRYQLTGLTADRCPECGLSLTPENRITGQPLRAVAISHTLLLVVTAGVCIMIHVLPVPRVGSFSHLLNIPSIWVAERLNEWGNRFFFGGMWLMGEMVLIEQYEAATGEVQRVLYKQYESNYPTIFYEDSNWSGGPRAQLISSINSNRLGLILPAEGGGNFGQLIVFDLGTGLRLPEPAQRANPGITRGGRMIVFGEDNTVYVWEKSPTHGDIGSPGRSRFDFTKGTTDEEVAAFELADGTVRVVKRRNSLMPDYFDFQGYTKGIIAGPGARLACLLVSNPNSRDSFQNCHILVRDIAAERWIARFAGWDDWSHTLRASKDGSRLLMYSESGNILAVYDLGE